jgi:hypothetical protein
MDFNSVSYSIQFAGKVVKKSSPKSTKSERSQRNRELAKKSRDNNKQEIDSLERILTKHDPEALERAGRSLTPPGLRDKAENAIGRGAKNRIAADISRQRKNRYKQKLQAEVEALQFKSNSSSDGLHSLAGPSRMSTASPQPNPFSHQALAPISPASPYHSLSSTPLDERLFHLNPFRATSEPPSSMLSPSISRCIADLENILRESDRDFEEASSKHLLQKWIQFPEA